MSLSMSVSLSPHTEIRCMIISNKTQHSEEGGQVSGEGEHLLNFEVLVVALRHVLDFLDVFRQRGIRVKAAVRVHACACASARGVA